MSLETALKYPEVLEHLLKEVGTALPNSKPKTTIVRAPRQSSTSVAGTVGCCRVKQQDVVWAVGSTLQGELRYFAAARQPDGWTDLMVDSAANQVVVRLLAKLSGPGPAKRTAISSKKNFDVGRCARTTSSVDSRCFSCNRLKVGQWRFLAAVRLCNSCGMRVLRTARNSRFGGFFFWQGGLFLFCTDSLNVLDCRDAQGKEL